MTHWDLGDLVQKRQKSKWRGRVVGFYSTEETPEGYNVESLFEPGSCQLWPAAALDNWDGTGAPAQLEAELAAKDAKIARLREALGNARAWAASLTVCDMNEVIADGGVTAGMLVGQEAGEQVRRIDAVLNENAVPGPAIHADVLAAQPPEDWQRHITTLRTHQRIGTFYRYPNLEKAIEAVLAASPPQE